MIAYKRPRVNCRINGNFGCFQEVSRKLKTETAFLFSIPLELILLSRNWSYWTWFTDSDQKRNAYNLPIEKLPVNWNSCLLPKGGCLNIPRMKPSGNQWILLLMEHFQPSLTSQTDQIDKNYILLEWIAHLYNSKNELILYQQLQIISFNFKYISSTWSVTYEPCLNNIFRGLPSG